MLVTYRTDVLVIGAGPAGLAAGVGCRARGRDFLVVEMGTKVGQRDHRNQPALWAGVGGSGLYSDGKFSFFPSASALWEIPDMAALEESWRWFSNVVKPLGVVAPPLSIMNGSPAPAVTGTVGDDRIRRKDYESIYMKLEDRKRLIETLEGECGTHLLPGVELRAVRYDEETRLFQCDIQAGGASILDVIEARAVIFAGGRFGPVGWTTMFSQMPQVFRRVEVGVRLVQSCEDFFLKDDPRPDPKLIPTSPDDRYSWRTFCCCRDGEVVRTEVRGVVSVSGRADGPTTGKSNVGFNLRVTDARLADSLWPNGCWPTGGDRRVASQPLNTFLENAAASSIAEVVGAGAAALLAEGLQHLCLAYPRLRESPCEVVAPAIEGVGQYPILNQTLRAGCNPLWVAGDATGIFRGLTAAMVSGYFTALQAACSEAPT